MNGMNDGIVIDVTIARGTHHGFHECSRFGLFVRSASSRSLASSRESWLGARARISALALPKGKREAACRAYDAASSGVFCVWCARAAGGIKGARRSSPRAFFSVSAFDATDTR